MDANVILAVKINHSVEDDLAEACRKRLPRETCGVLYGVDDEGLVSVTGFSVIRNLASDTSTSFSFDPTDWTSVFFAAQKNQRNIVGFFHSHPKGAANPSSEDALGWSPWGTYWIVGFADGRPEIKAYIRGNGAWIPLPFVRTP